jgi:hypothetical protein
MMDEIRNEEIRKELEIFSIEEKKYKVGWLEHLQGIGNERWKNTKTGHAKKKKRFGFDHIKDGRLKLEQEIS